MNIDRAQIKILVPDCDCFLSIVILEKWIPAEADQDFSQGPTNWNFKEKSMAAIFILHWNVKAKKVASLLICLWPVLIQLPRHMFVCTGAWTYEISREVLISASHNLLIRQLSLITNKVLRHPIKWLCPILECIHAPLLNMVSKASHLHWIYLCAHTTDL